MARNTASNGAIGPLGRKPPCAVYWGTMRPLSISAVPARMKATMVANLIIANQNSNRPKERTLRRHRGKPVSHVRGRGHQFGSDRKGDGGPVSGTCEKPQIFIQIEFAVNRE